VPGEGGSQAVLGDRDRRCACGTDKKGTAAPASSASRWDNGNMGVFQNGSTKPVLWSSGPPVLLDKHSAATGGVVKFFSRNQVGNWRSAPHVGHASRSHGLLPQGGWMVLCTGGRCTMHRRRFAPAPQILYTASGLDGCMSN
jgi:hypothetical protein